MTSLPKIYFISQGATPEDHLLGIEKVCRAGCKIVQLRLKGYSTETVEQTSKKAQIICEKYNVKLIINDFSSIAKEIPRVGLHLGKNDTAVSIAKQSLPSMLIGGTANTLEDCVKLNSEQVDYIGLGPYKFTATKSNLDPILGLNGYKEIITKLKSLKIKTPIYAIGGIAEGDISELLEIGIHGVAVSGLFANKTENEIKKIISLYE